MSFAPSKTPASAEPAFDLDCSVDDVEASPHADSRFLFRRIEEAMLREAGVAGGRTLDVACGVGQIAARLDERGCESWGLEPSREMIGVSRWLFPAQRVLLVRGVAETLPFRDASFDRVLCQGSLDHFVRPQQFMGEAARILTPQGRVVIALANYESLACRLGRAFDRLRSATPRQRRYHEPPPDHRHKGDLAFVRRLGGEALSLERCYGVSLLWLLDGWGPALDRLPAHVSKVLLGALDRAARRAPALADVIVSVWRPLCPEPACPERSRRVEGRRRADGG